MDKPKCKLCGARHYANEQHQFSKDSEPARPAPKPKKAPAPLQTGFDRKAYQREYMRGYMRKRRALNK